MPPRVVHLLGGLRVLDDQSGKAILQVSADLPCGEFPTTTYPELYGQLRALNFQVIGAEFLSLHSHRGLIARDWQCASPSGGFKIREERTWWDGARHVATDQDAHDVADLCSRISTYLALLPIRILQLSDAYNRTLRAYRLDSVGENNRFFDNSFRPYIDAAIHAFVADAASFRDVIAEATWTLVLRGTSPITKLAKFLEKAKCSTHPLAQSITMAGQEGGWLRSLTDLRNHITHVAPVGHASSFQFCQPRPLRVGEVEAVSLHYAMLDENDEVREFTELSNVGDDSEMRAAWQQYEAFCNTSLDALDYSWRALGRLVDLLGEVRSESGLRSETPTLTKDDLAGEVRFRVGDQVRGR